MAVLLQQRSNEKIKMAEPQKSASDSIIKPGVLQPTIIMKIDSPEEDSLKKENEDNEKNTCTPKIEEFKMCSPLFRPSTTSTNNPFASSPNRIARGILKPPQLNVNNVTTQNSKPFILKPSQLNPLARNSDDSEKINCENTENGDKSLVNGETPKFVPLVVPESKSQSATSINSKPSTSGPSISNTTFVFGQNLKERAIANETKQEEPKATTSLSSNGTSEGTTEMLFSTAIKNEVKIEGVTKEKETKTLSESAREYEESRASKRKYEEVEVITGEEDENNILKISCKLFYFDKASSSWQERGRGTLRLNDFQVDEHVGSRIVFRTTGSLRVILNTKIWAEMTIDKASDKSIRLTALDSNGEIKVFLIMSSIEDTNKLYSHLQVRLEIEIAAQKRKKQDATAVADSGGN